MNLKKKFAAALLSASAFFGGAAHAQDSLAQAEQACRDQHTPGVSTAIGTGVGAVVGKVTGLGPMFGAIVGGAGTYAVSDSDLDKCLKRAREEHSRYVAPAVTPAPVVDACSKTTVFEKAADGSMIQREAVSCPQANGTSKIFFPAQ